MTEGQTDSWAFQVNASVKSDLLYAFYINNSLRTLWTAIGDGSTFFGNITPAYTDETYGGFTNVTLVAMIPGFVHLNASRTWQANITHANSPVQFIKQIPDMESGYGAPLLLDLKEHFADPDYFDPRYNQNVTIDVVPNVTGNATSSISWSVDANWVVSFTASGVTSEVFNVTITDLNGVGSPLTRNTSNYFEVSFIPPIIIPQPVPVPSTGGGAGGSGSAPQKPQTLELLTPGMVSIDDANQVHVPITVSNKGSVAFNGITLGALLYVDGVVWPGAFTQFDISEILFLPPQRSESVELVVDLTGVPSGSYEIEINGTVANPYLTDVARVVITQQESESFTERLIFTEDLIVSNPECLELTELVEDARTLFESGQIGAAEAKLDEAIDGCRESLSQRSLFSRTRLRATLEDQVFRWLLVATIIAVVLGIVYYVYRRMEFIRIMRASAVPEGDIDLSDLPH